MSGVVFYIIMFILLGVVLGMLLMGVIQRSVYK